MNRTARLYEDAKTRERTHRERQRKKELDELAENLRAQQPLHIKSRGKYKQAAKSTE